jgi:ribonuclease P protein component
VQRSFRLTRSEDFKRVRRDGKSYAHPLVVLIALESENNDQSHVRIGVAAGKAVGTAVYRNRTKRLLREAMRDLIPNIASSLDLILIARPALASATLADTQRALLNLLQRAKIFTPKHES